MWRVSLLDHSTPSNRGGCEYGEGRERKKERVTRVGHVAHAGELKGRREKEERKRGGGPLFGVWNLRRKMKKKKKKKG